MRSKKLTRCSPRIFLKPDLYKIRLVNNISNHKFTLLVWSFHYTAILYAIMEDLNSLWPRDPVWQHSSGSTLACCLMTPSHYWTNVDIHVLHLFCGIYLRAISQKVLMNLIPNTTTSPRDQWVKSPDECTNLVKPGHYIYSELLPCSLHQLIK